MQVPNSLTARAVFDAGPTTRREPRSARGWLRLEGVTRNNLDRLDVRRETFLSAEKFVQNIAAIALAEAPVRGRGGVPERV